MTRACGGSAQEQDRIVLDMIERAAKRGDLCPKNDDIAAAVGGQTMSVGANIIARMERKNLIRVERFQCARRVTIVASGLSTRLPESRSAHWRSVPAKSRLPRPPRAQRSEFTRADEQGIGPVTVEEAAYIRFAYSRESEAFLAHFLERSIATLRVIAGATSA